MIKLYKTLFWVLAAAACIVILSIRPQAAEAATTAYTVLGNGTGTDSSLAAAQIINGVTVVSSEDALSQSTAAGTDTASKTGTVASQASSGSDTAAVVTISETPAVSGSTNASSGTKAKGPGAVPAASGSGSDAAESSSDAAGSSSQSTASLTPNYTVTGSGDSAIYSFEGHKYRKSSLYGSRKLTGYTVAEDGSARTASGKTARPQHTVSVPSDIPLGTILIVEGTEGTNASAYTGVYVAEDRGSNVDAKGLMDIYFASYAEAAAVTADGWTYANVYIAEAIE